MHVPDMFVERDSVVVCPIKSNVEGFNENISRWNTSNVTTMESIFEHADSK